ncbi:MAG: TolC family protein, partial [Rikenella sp.]|nr:TolC family protein [Rikenella sp.]
MQIDRKILLIFGTLTALGSTPAFGDSLPRLGETTAATADSTRTLTLQEAVEIGYRQSPALEAQRIAREAAVARRKAAWGLRLPQLGVAANYTYLADDIKAFDLNAEKDAALGQIGQLPLPIPIPPQIVQAIQGLDLSLTLQKQQFAVVGAS